MHGRPWIAALAGGLVVGALSSIGEAHLHGTLAELANSISTWLVAPFVVGTLARSPRSAAGAGFATSAAQLAGYYAVAALRDFETTGSLVAFWVACAVVGGPLFGLAGHLWRSGPTRLRGLGMAALAGVFVAEGAYAYAHQLDDYLTGVVWTAIGATFAAVSSGGRAEQLRWLGLTIPLGLAGEIALTAVLERSF